MSKAQLKQLKTILGKIEKWEQRNRVELVELGIQRDVLRAKAELAGVKLMLEIGEGEA